MFSLWWCINQSMLSTSVIPGVPHVFSYKSTICSEFHEIFINWLNKRKLNIYLKFRKSFKSPFQILKHAFGTFDEIFLY